MRPTLDDIAAAFDRLRSEWPNVRPDTPAPSLEVFTEAVKRANEDTWMSPVGVANSILDGRWPPDAR